VRHWLWVPLIVLLAPATVCATPFTVTFDDVLFSDGGTLTGWFKWRGSSVYDYTITVAGGDTSLFPDLTYTRTNSTLGTANEDFIAILFGIWPDGSSFDLTNKPRVVLLTFLNPLSLGLDTTLNTDPATGSVSYEQCGANCRGGRLITNGTVLVSGDLANLELLHGLPEPSTLLLTTLGVLTVGAKRRRHTCD
jgi:hypothetical protein